MHIDRLAFTRMTIREVAINKLQKLPEALLQQVSDFIDFLTYKNQIRPEADTLHNTLADTWSKWFESVDQLQVEPTDSVNDYQQHLLSKYRKQGLEL